MTDHGTELAQPIRRIVSEKEKEREQSARTVATVWGMIRRRRQPQSSTPEVNEDDGADGGGGGDMS